MARPIEPTPVLTGADAERFLKEKERIDSLKSTDPEYKARAAFFRECKEIARKYRPVNL
jgi:hypothetical protein